MNKLGRLLILVLVPLLVGCDSGGGGEGGGAHSLNSHEHKLLLNPDKFEDLGKGFKDCWELVKATAAAHELKVVEFDDKFVQRHNVVAFYDTPDLKMVEKGFLIRKRAKVKHGKPADSVTLTLKFKSTAFDQAAAADLTLAVGYTPKDAEIEVESDIIDASDPHRKPDITYSVQNSTVLDQDSGSTLGDYTKIFPVLATLGIDPATELVRVNGIEIEEHMIKPGLINFGDDLFGRVDISVWIFDGKMIPEFSYDHPLEHWESQPAASTDQCEAFIGVLQGAAPAWCVEGKLKAAFVFEK